MITSYLLARMRIKAGTRPGFVAAWGPVLIDWVIVLGVLALTWNASMRFINTTQPGVGLTMLYFFTLYFLPMQVVIIIAAMWAARSRWQDKDPHR